MKDLEASISRHCLIARAGHAHETLRSNEEAEEQMNKIDKEHKDYKTNAEQKFQWIWSGKIPFSPEATEWIINKQVFQKLLRYHAGRKVNKGNLHRKAQKCKVYVPIPPSSSSS